MTPKTATRRDVEPDTNDNQLVAAFGPASEDEIETGFHGATDRINLNGGRVPAKQGPVEATRPDPEQSRYWQNVQTRQTVDVAKQPERRPGKPEDKFRIITWPKWDNVPLGAYGNRLKSQGMPLPSEMTRAELIGVNVQIADAVHAGYLEPTEETIPEQPYLTPGGFCEAFMTRYTNDPCGRLEAVFEFLRNPQRHELSWQIPQPVPAAYKKALTDTLKPSPATLKTLLLEMDRSDPATQPLAIVMLKRASLAASGKAAQSAIPILQRLLTDFAQWDGDTVKLLLTLLTTVQSKPAKLEFMLLRRLQLHENNNVRTSALSAEFTLFVEPRL